MLAGRGDTWTALTTGQSPVRDVAVAGDGTLDASRRGQIARLARHKLVPIAAVKGDPLPADQDQSMLLTRTSRRRALRDEPELTLLMPGEVPEPGM